MNHVVGYDAFLLRLEVFKNRFLCVGSQRDEIVSEIRLDVAVGDVLLKRFAILLDGKKVCERRCEDDFGLSSQSVPPQPVLREVQDLLRSASALDGSDGMCEEGGPSFELAKRLPGVIDVLIGVVAAHSSITNGLFKPGDLVPVDLDSRGNDEPVVGNGFPLAGQNSIFFRVETRDGIANPSYARGMRVASFRSDRLLGNMPPPTRVQSGW